MDMDTPSTTEKTSCDYTLMFLGSMHIALSHCVFCVLCHCAVVISVSLVVRQAPMVDLRGFPDVVVVVSCTLSLSSSAALAHSLSLSSSPSSSSTSMC